MCLDELLERVRVAVSLAWSTSDLILMCTSSVRIRMPQPSCLWLGSKDGGWNEPLQGDVLLGYIGIDDV